MLNLIRDSRRGKTLGEGPFLSQKTGKRLPCLHGQTFAGRKNMEHEVRNVRLRYRVGGSSYSIEIKGCYERGDA